MLIALAILTVVILTGCVFWFINWWNSKPTYGLKIKFKQFLAMYKIEPNRWTLDRDGTVCYDKCTEYLHQWFYFSPIDYLRYKSFYRGRKKYKQKLNSDAKWEKIIISWQKDIDKYKEKYTKELQYKIEEINNGNQILEKDY